MNEAVEGLEGQAPEAPPAALGEETAAQRNARLEAAVPEDQKKLAKRLLGQVHSQRESKGYERYFAVIEKNRLYAAGEQHSDGENGVLDEEGVVRANLILPELKKATIEAYARNPEFAIEPTKAVPAAQYNAWREVGLTCERLLEYQFSPAQANLKSAIKRAVRGADTTGHGWLKVVYQKDILKDPILTERLHDTQDDLQRLDRLIDETREIEKGTEEYESKRVELQQQIDTLQKELEAKRVDGFVLAVRPSECITVSPDAVTPDDYGRADWIVDTIYMTVERATERFGWVPDSATRYAERKIGKEHAMVGKATGDDADCDQLVCVHEMWRLSDRRIYTLLEGFKGFIRPPYSPKPVGERFHGLFSLHFDVVDGRHHAVALVSQLCSMQDEHVQARTNFREHRERAVPFNVANGQAMGATSVAKLTNPKFMETVVLEDLDPALPVEQAFKHVASNPIDPSVYSTEHIRTDWEQVTRRGDSARGVVSKAKTAAEAEILQANLSMDQSERQDVVEDFLRELSQYCLEIMMQEMTPQQVKRIAGPDAQWPQLSRGDVFNMVQLTIRAGSTGKPKAQENLDKWVKILPELRETLITIVQLREGGKHDEARIQLVLLKESLRRFDERINVDELIPEPDDQDKAAQQQQQLADMQQQQQQLALQMKQIVSEIANTDADTIQKIADAESKEAGMQIDLYLGIMDRLIAAKQQQNPTSTQLQ